MLVSSASNQFAMRCTVKCRRGPYSALSRVRPAQRITSAPQPVWKASPYTYSPYSSAKATHPVLMHCISCLPSKARAVRHPVALLESVVFKAFLEAHIVGELGADEMTAIVRL